MTYWANTLGDEASWQNLFRLYPEIIIGKLPTLADLKNPSLLKPPAKRSTEVIDRMMAAEVQRNLRAAWTARDMRTFDWSVWIAQSYYLSAWQLHAEGPLSAEGVALGLLVPLEHPPQVITAVEAALYYFKHNRAKVLYCQNPGCNTPYFFQKKKHPQKYCSPECATPSRQESKRNWWANNKGRKAS